MVSVQSSTQSLNFMRCHLDQFPDENTIHPTIKDKDGNPMSVRDICTRDYQRVQDFQDQGYNVEIIWEKTGKLSSPYLAQHRTRTDSTTRNNNNNICHSIALTLTLKSI